ncbi:MAG TPA: hypothetical protein PKV16_05680 [Caldisericia bacterium]|nr:hypothetical protein [Caldisericia bacterium]HPF49322.1 hypothetical protein [Caldisericia bacterium]HPI83998.1 hypothetical protein [Caldisericia bacterium]HPQ93256.1 hypothetical protein [Caldisericia bacterium]HRV75362.1 hypothetical protein [Caldisericia bacterium]
MLYIPKGLLKIEHLPVNSVDLSDLPVDMSGSCNLVEIRTNLTTYGMVLKNSEIEEVFECTNTIAPLGQRGIDRLLSYTRNNASTLVTSELNEELHEFYLNLAEAEYIHRNLSDSYFSFWNFAHHAQDVAFNGCVILQSEDKTLWNIIKDGESQGGFEVCVEPDSTKRLSAKTALEHSVEFVGRVDVLAFSKASFYQVDEDVVLSRTPKFIHLLNSDSTIYRHVIDEFGEVGVELALKFCGEKTIKQISQETREPFEKVMSLGNYLGKIRILKKKESV